MVGGRAGRWGLLGVEEGGMRRGGGVEDLGWGGRRREGGVVVVGLRTWDRREEGGVRFLCAWLRLACMGCYRLCTVWYEVRVRR